MTRSKTNSSPPHVSSSTVYSDSDHNNNRDSYVYDNAYLRKGKGNRVDVKSEGESSVKKFSVKQKVVTI
jgi:hypothetical protein